VSEPGEDLRRRFITAAELSDEAGALEVVKEVYAAGSRGDWDLLAPLFDPEVRWEPPPQAPTAAVHRGVQGAAEEVAAWTEPFADFNWEPRGLRLNSERVLVWGRMSGRGRGSGVEVDVEEFHVITLHHGRIVRLQMFLDAKAALGAAGLEGDPG
jgi:ketosteroid isomerase-like protein